MRSAPDTVTTGKARPLGVEPVRGGEILDRTSTGADLIQWLDFNADTWTSTISPDLLRRDLHLTERIRTGAQYPKRRNRHGWYAWTGTRRHVWFESALEMETLVDLDQGGSVTAIGSQPFRILFRGGSPCLSHVPDYFAVLSDGTQVLYDVKPASRMTPEVVEQFAETARVCAIVGWRHEVVHQQGIARRENLALLRQYRHARCHPSPDHLTRVLDVFTGGRSIDDGRRMLNLRNPALAMPAVWHLTWHGLLDFAIEEPLGEDTVLTTSRKGSTCCVLG